jgi:hypothetical protein
MTAASGSREVPEARGEVWRALAVLEPYCAVCDVSYVVSGQAGRGAEFVCVPGRLEGRTPGPSAPHGTPETWTTRIELEDTEAGGTRVTIAVTHEPKGGSRLVRRVQRAAMQRLVQRTVDGELAKLPAHIAQVAAAG